jgi:YadA head domain repeat (2 copies)
MHKTTLKKLALALTFWLALHTHSLKAQILGPDGTGSTVFEVDAHGLLSSTGTFGTGTLSLSGAGTRMLWYPGKAAFRAGAVNGTQWNDASVGGYSAAFGLGNTASGLYSVAFGSNNIASGNFSTASGNYTTASGYNSIALGQSSTASGNYALAMGISTQATSLSAFAGGESSIASGQFSIAWGVPALVSSYASVAFGRLNVGGGNPNAWVATDPLFELGNGTYSPPPSNTPMPADAMVVYKNGNGQFHGDVRASAGGDISMGSFTAGTHP